MVFRTKLDGLETRSTGDLTPCAAGSLLSRLLSGPHNSEKTSVFVPIKLQADPPLLEHLHPLAQLVYHASLLSCNLLIPPVDKRPRFRWLPRATH